MRTTITIDSELLKKMEEAANILRLSKNKMISLLLARIIREDEFEPRPYERVTYQKRDKDFIILVKEHINIDSVFYEKYLDLRRNFKFSVSWLIGFAIKHYLNELVYDLNNPRDHKKILDNYARNFVYITRMVDNIPFFISILGFPDHKTLERLML